MKAIEKLE